MSNESTLQHTQKPLEQKNDSGITHSHIENQDNVVEEGNMNNRKSLMSL